MFKHFLLILFLIGFIVFPIKLFAQNLKVNDFKSQKQVSDEIQSVFDLPRFSAFLPFSLMLNVMGILPIRYVTPWDIEKENIDNHVSGSRSYIKLIILIFFIFLSLLSAFFSGLIALKDIKVSKIKFTLLGLSNFFTLIGFVFFSYLFLRNKNNKKLLAPKPEIYFKKRAFWISFILSFVYFVFLVFKKRSLFWEPDFFGQNYSFHLLGGGVLIVIIALTVILWVFLFFVSWFFLKNKKIFWFSFLFLFFFVLFDYLFEYMYYTVYAIELSQV